MRGAPAACGLLQPTPASAPTLEQFRADFKYVFAAWILWGYHNKADYDFAAQAVKDNAHDAGWMAGAAAHFADLSRQIREDIARSERIRDEVRAEREAA